MLEGSLKKEIVGIKIKPKGAVVSNGALIVYRSDGERSDASMLV